jgi:uncharacterized protein with FMN-binding domain
MRRVVLAIVATVVSLVVLLSFKTHSTPAVLSSPPAAVADPSTSSTPSGSGTPTSDSGGTSTKTVTGDPEDTRFGPVQVRITVRNGQLTAVQAVEYPTNSPRDVEINAYAIPQLNQEAVAAKSARIDMVSGATYTSDGYIASLQSALDKVSG